MTVVKGHGLRSEGAAHYSPGCQEHPCSTWFHIDDGRRVNYWTTAGQGHAVCRCGAYSTHLPSAAARKRWHRAHKAEVTG